MKKTRELDEDIKLKLKKIGEKVSELRKSIEPNYKRFAEKNDFNSMTLWRIQQGEDYKISSFIELLKALKITPEDFFKGLSD